MAVISTHFFTTILSTLIVITPSPLISLRLLSFLHHWHPLHSFLYHSSLFFNIDILPTLFFTTRHPSVVRSLHGWSQCHVRTHPRSGWRGSGQWDGVAGKYQTASKLFSDPSASFSTNHFLSSDFSDYYTFIMIERYISCSYWSNHCITPTSTKLLTVWL